MSSFIRFLLFAHGNIISGNWGPEYDRGPIKKVKVPIGVSFSEFVGVICRAAGIDMSSTPVEILHRHPHYIGNTASYQLVRIADEEDLEGLVEMAMQFGSEKIQDLYVRKCDRPAELEEDDAMGRNTPPVVGGQNFCCNPPMERQTLVQEPEIEQMIESQTQVDVGLEHEQIVEPEYDPEPLDDNNAILTCHNGWENR